MKSTAIACVIAAASLGFGSLSYAQGGHDWGRDARGQDRHGYASQPRHHDQRYQQHQQFDQRAYGRYGHPGQRSAQAPQYGYPQYRRGEHLPFQFRQRQHHVNDWRAHRLYAPPQGYHWVQADNGSDYLLVAIATGLIANLLINQ